MRMWMIIMLVTLLIVGLSLIYLSERVSNFDFIGASDLPKWRRVLRGFLLVFLIFVIIAKLLNPVNACVCVFYFAGIWLVCDLGFDLAKRFLHFECHRYCAGYTAIILSLLSLLCGWYLDHHVWEKEYTFYTSKLKEPLKIVMFADSHIGTTFKADVFVKHLKSMQAHNPDMVIIAGDYIDDDTKKDDMIASTKALGKMQTKYGVYFVFGNHDEGYYGKEYRGYSGLDLVKELKKNGVNVLVDDVKLLNNEIYIVGRKDASAEKERRGGRLTMADLTRPLDKSKYIITIDHQPNDYKAQTEAKVDLVLSGHTHGGQLFPLNQVGKWIGANDLIYGHEKRDKTDFIVTSGISDWSIKFKTGTKSEYVIINLLPQK